MQSNHLLLEELRFLEQRRQQQRELYQQQQMPLMGQFSGAPSKYPLSSALLSLTSSLGGASGLGVAPPRHSVTPPPSTTDAILLRQLQDRLRGGGAVPADTMQTIQNLLVNAAPGSLNSLTVSDEDLLRTLAAPGYSLAPPQTIAGLNSVNAPTIAMQPSHVHALSGPTLARKREGGALVGAGHNGTSKKHCIHNPQATQANNMMNAVHVLASAAELEMKERTDAARMMTALASAALLASNASHTFPLPPKVEKKGAPTGVQKFVPKLDSFRKAWDSVKSKDMQKEIFLRKLHDGKLLGLSPSSSRSSSSSAAAESVVQKTAAVDNVKASTKPARQQGDANQATAFPARTEPGQPISNCQAV